MSLAGRIATAVAAVFGAVSVAAPGVAQAIEQPAYTVTAEHGGWQLRSYSPTIEARVTVTGPWDTAVSDGFRVLAGYIFGGNQPRASIAMTAPVAAQRGPDAAGDEQWTVAFTMPAQWSLDSLPVPNDPRIELVQVPPRQVAALSFGLWATESRVAEKTSELLDGLGAVGLTPLAEPTVAQYNPPWTPPPFRNNEVLVTVGPAQLATTRN